MTMIHSSRTSPIALRQMWQRLSAFRPRAWVFWCLLPATALLSFFVVGQSSPPAIPAVNLSADPLYAAGAVDKPALALALSVEFPTVGAQYLAGVNATTDNTYANTNEYLGYYDAESCYTYNDAPTETPASGLTTTDYKRFDRSGPAASRMCTNAFSGNFLNWASSSAIDMLRLALSGGDRYIDTASLTILQRAVIPNGDPTCMWNSTNFPAKQLSRNGGGAGAYWGAVPTAMITAAGTNDIWVANTLNRIYFGTSNTGACGSTSAYTLGAPSSSASIGTISSYSGSRPADTWTTCASENGTCSFSGVKEVWYGANSSWKYAPASNGVSCSNGVFGDPIVGTAKNCYYRNYTGSWSPSTGTLNSDGFFYSRVQVCNTSSGALQDIRDYGLCKVYPNGNYKPTGVVQKYSDQLRLAAFGYVMDQTTSASGGRYGGVLRAPMKYVGAKTFDYNGVDNTASGGNPNAEWNASTGVFATNPDGDTTQTPQISGVINYLNKFGRTGPVQGRYKMYDPVGELHYEVLRYLQGLQPTSSAVSSLTSAMYDGFPVFTSWTDPYGGGRSSTADYSCLKSNIVVIGDIHTWDGGRLPSASAANNIPDINYWRSIVQAFEQNQSTSYSDGQGTSRTTGNPNGSNGSVPGSTDRSQILGSAYWARTHDIRGTGWTASTGQQRPGLRVKTFLFDVNEYGEGNTPSNLNGNQFFMAAKYGGFETDPSNPGSKPYNIWGNPFKKQSSTSDNIGTNDNNVWQDSARPVPGATGSAPSYYAASYYMQSNARGVLSAFDAIFSRASSSSRSIAGVATQSSSISTALGSFVYQGAFDTSSWSGDVLAIPVSVNASNTLAVGAAVWSAADRLAALPSPASSRNIFVGKVGATASPTATAFTWGAIESSLQTNLNKASPSSTADGLGQDRLNFLRGDRSKEGNPFRVRSKILGDIVNSSVVYSGTPSLAFADAAYTSFYSSYSGRTPAVFVGANDGMLHAFNATTGDELFAYIPSWMGSKLSALTTTTYANNHQSYVDGPPTVGEAQVGSAGTAADWKTVLVSGTGAGGAGVFALDVSNPSSFSASNVMWEFTKADDADMGSVIGQPRLLKLRTSATGNTFKWFAVVASGVNNYVTDSAGLFSSTGKPALFLLALDKAAGAAWVLNTNYYKISIPFDATLAITKPTGAANFGVNFGLSGEATQIYVGDFHGKLWKLDFAGHGTSDWSINQLSSFNNGSSSNPLPMYIAKDSAGNVQPITSAPFIFYGPTLGGLKTYYVLIGTGKYLELSDKTSTAQNTMYALYDNGTSTLDDTASSATAAISGRGRLQAGSVNTTTRVVSVPTFKWGRALSDSDTVRRSGWYFDMPVTGERLVSAIDSAGTQATFNTLIPSTAGSSGTCSNTLGSGNSYIVDIVSGSGTYVVSTVGLPGPTNNFDVGAIISPSDSTGRRWRTPLKRTLLTGQGGVDASSSVPFGTPEVLGRLSWRQINNYQDLKAAP